MLRVANLKCVIICSEIEEPGNPNSEVAAPLSGLIGGAESEGQNVAPPKDGSLEEELLLELKMKDADNKFLHEELRKLRDNLREKESMLAMLTEGLKEVCDLVATTPVLLT